MRKYSDSGNKKKNAYKDSLWNYTLKYFHFHLACIAFKIVLKPFAPSLMQQIIYVICNMM